MRPGADYPARALMFPEDRTVGDVRFIGADRQPGEPVPARGSVEVPEGMAAAFFGAPDGPAVAGATGLTHLFLDGEIDDAFADVVAGFPFLRQIRAGTRGLSVDGAKKLLAAPHLAGLTLNVQDEERGGAAIATELAAIDDVAIELVVGAAAVSTVCELIAGERLSQTVDLDVGGADERALLPLRKLAPDKEFNGVRYSPKALARLEASLGDSA